MAAPESQFLLMACGLPKAWQNIPVWKILDTGFGDGSNFFTTWQAWADDNHRPRLLHYVAITPIEPGRDAVLRRIVGFSALAAHAADLGRQWFGLLPGFHRLTLQRGQVLLTLCIGPLQPMLRAQQFLADSVYLSGRQENAPDAPAWDRWSVKALARLCRRGTGIGANACTAQARGELLQAGFAFDGLSSNDLPAVSIANHLQGQYQPRWETGSSRQTWRAAPSAVSSCVVVGAGLAGATVAAALARRGWQVTVLDMQADAAGGASGLPVGLLAPQLSRDDSARSRLSRAGVRLTLQLCDRLLQHGEDWSCSGVMELRGGDAPAIWHAHAGWIKPACLVRACLAQAGVRFAGRSKVQSITRDAGQWMLLDAAGQVLARAPQLVVTAAFDSARLLDGRLTPMRSVGGQISWAPQRSDGATTLPAYPVNGLGSFVAHVPLAGAPAWFAGATYEPEPALADSAADGHRENFERLARLLPATARTLAEDFALARVLAWRGTRCTTIDRLPALGPLDVGPQPTLWVSAGMGSRGLTYAVLCAELLAAQLGREPLPIEARLLKSINPMRGQLQKPC